MTLVETLKEINIKHDGTRTKLTKTCADNTAANALAENTASGIKDTCLADYQDEKEICDVQRIVKSEPYKKMN